MKLAAPPVLDSAKRARALANVGRARVANAWLRLTASAIVAAVATSIVGAATPLLWWLGLVPVIMFDRWIFGRLLKRCQNGDTPRTMPRIIVWTAVQSIYGNIIAATLWFSPYVPGETLAIIYMFGGLANAAATLRSSVPLSIAGAGCTIAFLLGLPMADYLINGARNPLDLMPMMGGLLLLAFGVNLWKSLLASDAAQLEAEAAVLRERQAAAAAAAAKSSVIQRMNDELRTPMSALAGAAEHLRRAAQSPQARAHIATIVQAGEVLRLVLNDLSDLDRLENGHVRIEARPTDPRDVLRGVVSAFRAAAQDKGLELFVDVDPETPASLEIDAGRVRQVLFNLLANAIRYTMHGGVRVRMSAQTLGGGLARLSVIIADTGAGMSRAQLALIFGRERLCADGEGPGLGLAISLRLAKLMGGKLTAKSELGEGSVFAFSLDAPVTAAASSAA
ncbi:MAG: HAMP domain-containing sensor histidine kinase [Hyphomonadaceae bacterium]